MTKISFASIQVIEKCNLNCGFCFKRLNLPIGNTSKIKKIISELKGIGVETIVISGGEPILRDDILEIFRYIKQLGLESALQSNGIYLGKKIDELAPYIDWLSLSLDGDNEKTASEMRGFNGYLKNTLKIINLAKNKYHLKIKLGTVVNRLNIDHIENIGDLIAGKVDTWKLYQFYPRAGCKSEKNSDIYSISKVEYEKIANKIIKKYPKINISKHNISDYNRGPCLMIDPDGKVFISKNNSDFFIGNILKNSKDIVQACKKQNNFEEIEKNFNKTYKI